MFLVAAVREDGGHLRLLSEGVFFYVEMRNLSCRKIDEWLYLHSLGNEVGAEKWEK